MRKFTILLILVLLFSTASARDTGLVYHEVQVVDEVGRPVTDISSVEIYLPDTTTNQVIYADRGQNLVITIPMTTGSANTTLSNGTFSWYGQDGWDFSITDGTNISTNATHRTRTASEHRLVFPSYLTSITTVALLDGQTMTYGTSSDWVAESGTVSDRMTWTPATTSTSAFYIGNASFTADLNLFGDGGFHVIWDASEDTLELLDNVVLAVGTGDDYTITHNGSATTITGAYTTSGIVTHSVDVIFDGTNDALWDDSESTFQFNDNTVAGFGNTGAAPDVEMTWDTDSWNWIPSASDTDLEVGSAADGFDWHYFFEDAGEFFWDYDGDFINLTDDMDIRFGTGASSDGDFQISSSSANLLTIGQIVAGTGSVAVGVDDAGLDWTFFGDTTAIFSMWDTSANFWHYEGQAVVFEFEGVTADGNETTLSVTDPTADVVYTLPDAGAGTYSLMSSTLATNAPGIANSVTGGTNQLIYEGTADGFETIVTANDATADATLAFPDDSGDVVYAPEGVVDYAAGAGALPITHAVITYESTGGAEALTLADGKPGQLLQVNHDTDGGNGVITPATALGYTSIDLADDGDMVTFMFVDTQGWIIIGTAGNAAPPVVTP